MTALSLLSAEGQTIGVAPYVPRTFGRGVSSVFGDALYRSRINPAPYITDKLGFDERDSLIRERFNVTDPFSVIDTKDIDEKYTNPTMDGRVSMLNEKQARLDAYIQEQRKIDPEKWRGIKTKQEIEEFTRDVARTARSEMEETLSRMSPTKAAIAALVGGVAGAFTDPINIATLPLGASASMGILRAMGVEALVNMGVEAVESPAVAKWQKELGFKYGIGEAATDIATAGIGGAAFTGIIRGSVHGIRALGSKSVAWLERGAASAKKSELRDAFKYQARSAHIDETIPVEGRSLTREDIITQRQSLQETQDAIESYRQPDLRNAEARFSNANVTEETVTAKALELSPKRIDEYNFLKKEKADISEAMAASRENRVVLLNESAPNKVEIDALKSKIEDASPRMKKKYEDKINDLIAKDKAWIEEEIKREPPELASMRERLQEIDYKMRDSAEKVSAIYKEARKQLGVADVSYGVRAPLDEVAVERAVKSASEPLPETNVTPDFKNLKLVEQHVPELRSPNDNIEAMQAITEAASSPETRAAFDADFQRIVKESPEEKLLVDGQEMTVGDLYAMIKDDEIMLQAIKTCGVG